MKPKLIMLLCSMIIYTFSYSQDCQVDGGQLQFTSGDTSQTVCLNDPPAVVDVQLDSAVGAQQAWVITDTAGTILGLPTAPPFNFDSAGVGVCLIWHISFQDTLVGAEIDSNAANLMGCFDLSNPIQVIRQSEELSGGSISTSDPTDLCVGDGQADLIDVVLENNIGPNGTWLITDTSGTILSIPNAPPFDFESAGNGVCQIWYLSYGDGISGLVKNNNIQEVEGCYALSNPIDINRNGVNGGILSSFSGDSLVTICAGDGIADPFDIILDSVEGSESEWVITDVNGQIIMLNASPPFDFEGAGEGTCLLWHLSYRDTVIGLEVDSSALNLSGCFDLSNPLQIERLSGTPVAGTISTTDATSFCVGDNQADLVDVSVEGDSSDMVSWVITDSSGQILSLPDAPPFDFDDAGIGTCFIWHLAYTQGLQGLEEGNSVSQLGGCYALSNSIQVDRLGVEGGSLTTTDSLTEISICAGDGMSDAFDVILSGNTGATSSWVITDTSGRILGLPTSPPFDLDTAGAGICLLWNISYEDTLTGLELGNNVSQLAGCYGLSNAITINRSSGVDPGTITLANGGTDTTICVGDGQADVIDPILTGWDGDGLWILTDTLRTIITSQSSASFDLESAEAGFCQIWHIATQGTIGGAEPGNSVDDLMGCFGISNPISINRQKVDGGSLSLISGSVDTTICTTDSISDAFSVTLTGHQGTMSSWLITDINGTILGTPMAPPFDLEGTASGTCLLWQLSSIGTLSGDTIGGAAADLQGCYALSNAITINRTCDNDSSEVAGGTLRLADGGDELTICSGDGIRDAIDISLTGNVGAESAWIITDTDLMILELPAGPPFDLEGVGAGSCLIWSISYNGEIEGLSIGSKADEITGDFALSTNVTINRNFVRGGILSTLSEDSEITICTEDNISDAFDVQLDSAEGENMAWVITDAVGTILDFPSEPPFDFEGVAPGTCLLWHLSFQGSLEGDSVGASASDLVGCFSLSNPITVNRTCDTTQVNVSGGYLSLGDSLTELTICAGDGSSDAFDVDLDNAQGESMSWIITDQDGLILDLPEDEPFDLDGAGPGVCLLWNISSSGPVEGLEIGSNAEDIVGNYALSNPITITRNYVNGGILTTTTGETDVSICAGDGVSDAFNVDLDDAAGESEAWVITDEDGKILDLPSGPPFDLESAGPGVCLLWHLRYYGEIDGAKVGQSADNLSGCFALSNPITVDRTGGLEAGEISLLDGTDGTTICAGDSVPDPLEIVYEEFMTDTSTIVWGWVITNDDGEILDLPSAPPFDLDGAGAGTCLIWRIVYREGLSGAEVGKNAEDLSGCFDLSNPITVYRLEGSDCFPDTGKKIEQGKVEMVSGEWINIQLSNNYESMVVVATPVLDKRHDKPVVTRIRNAEGNSFQLRVQNPGGELGEDEHYTVYYVVAEEGIYTVEEDGIKMEALQVESDKTSSKHRWVLESRDYEQLYEHPVVIGQVMSYEDEKWSVFWAADEDYRWKVPTTNSLSAGKHVGEDRARNRETETIGMLILEQGTYQLDDQYIEAGRTSFSVRGVSNTGAGYKQNTQLKNLSGGVLSAATQRGSNGGWPVFRINDGFTNKSFRVAIEEDQIRDHERIHPWESVAYLVFGSSKSSQQLVSEVSKTEAPPRQSSIVIRPNPADQRVELQLLLNKAGQVTLQLFDIQGKELYQINQQVNKGTNTFEIETSSYPNGIYHLRYKTDDEVLGQEKIVIHH